MKVTFDCPKQKHFDGLFMKSFLQAANSFISEYPEFRKQGQVPFSDNTNQLLGSQNLNGKLDGFIFFLQEQRITWGDYVREKFMVPYKIAAYENGILNGPTVHFQQDDGRMKFDDKGNFVKDMVFLYKDGVLEKSEIYKDGIISERNMMKNGVTAQTIRYGKDGSVLEEINFKNDRLNGDFFSRSNEFFLSGSYKDDLRDGLWKVDDRRTGFKFETHYTEGLKNGLSFEKEEGGWVMGEYVRGVREGIFFFIDDGKKTSSNAVVYSNGDPQFNIRFDEVSIQEISHGVKDKIKIQHIEPCNMGTENKSLEVTNPRIAKNLETVEVNQITPN
jgi:antitoxin component YwqK of YwqJK toxin-antitoxin module